MHPNKSSFLRFFVLAILFCLTLFALLFQFGKVPPIGTFFSPSEGFWAKAGSHTLPTGELYFGLPGLEEEVVVAYDSLTVPHIFAKNTHDAYFMQGFVTAKDRLWQMEIQTLAAAGRLTEILGKDLMGVDQYQRRIGMVYGAENALAYIIESDTVTYNALKAYTKGVNAWIDNLNPKFLPLEYKVLNYEPKQWTELKSMLLLQYMIYDLTAGSQDLNKSRFYQMFGEEAYQKYISFVSDWTEPIIPSMPIADAQPTATPADMMFPDSLFNIYVKKPHENNGSNNWAVSGDKTKSGYPILANDPHLTMSAPSLWYEIQIHTPDMNVMGVSLPGAPAVIIGHNEAIAWGTTNVAADVFDFYALKTRKMDRRLEYYHDGKWKAAKLRIEHYFDKGGEEVGADTLWYTHHGPIIPPNASNLRSREIPGHALKWIGHESANNVRTFLKLNTASDYDSFKDALSTFVAPAQNFVYADTSGNISMWVNGKFPNKWKYQGRFVLDGTDPKADWPERIPFEHNPHELNPERHFVSSANQASVGDDYPYYLNETQGNFTRGKRINDILRSKDDFDVQAMRNLQMDDLDLQAEKTLPFLLGQLTKVGLSTEEQRLISRMEAWDYHMKGNKIEPTIYDTWWKFFNAEICDPVFPENVIQPYFEKILDLVVVQHKEVIFEDIVEGGVKVQPAVQTAWTKTISYLKEKYGKNPETWTWAKDNSTTISHIASIPGMGFGTFDTDGSRRTVNAISHSHGPSMRFIVEMGPEVKSYLSYPGGQSGNPGSPFYDSFVDEWLQGEQHQMQFYKNKEEAKQKSRYHFFMRAHRKDKKQNDL